MTRAISGSRPITGSSLPSRARLVKLRPNWSSIGVPAGTSHAVGAAPAVGPFGPAAGWPKSDSMTRRRTWARSTPRLASICVPDVLALPDQAEEQVLGAYVFVAEPKTHAMRARAPSWP